MSKKEDSTVEVEEHNEELKHDPEEDSFPWYQQVLWALALVGLVQVLATTWTLVKNPAMTYSAITGEPYDFYDAVKQLDLHTVPQATFKQTTGIGIPLAAGIVISENSMRVYDLGPNIELEDWGDVTYPGDVLEIEMWDWRIHSRDRHGQLIKPLSDWMTRRAEHLKLLMGSDVELRVLIAADKQASFEITRLVMYTAGQAQHHEFHQVLDSVAGKRLLPYNLPSIGPPEVINALDSANSSPAGDEGESIFMKHMNRKLKAKAEAKANATGSIDDSKDDSKDDHE